MSDIITASVILAGTYSIWKMIDSYYRMKWAETKLKLFREMLDTISFPPPPPSLKRSVETVKDGN